MSAYRYDCVLKLLVFGDSGVGKSSLLSQFADRKCPDAPVSTVGIDSKQHTLVLESKVVKLHLFDMAGIDKYHATTRQFLRRADGIALVYDVTDSSSFRSIPGWVEEIKAHCKQEIGVVLAGNKCDLESQRAVGTAAGRKLATELSLEFFETCARDAEKVDDVFLALVKATRDSVDGIICPTREEETSRSLACCHF